MIRCLPISQTSYQPPAVRRKTRVSFLSMEMKPNPANMPCENTGGNERNGRCLLGNMTNHFDHSALSPKKTIWSWMEAQSHSDDPILSQDHPYIREAHDLYPWVSVKHAAQSIGRHVSGRGGPKTGWISQETRLWNVLTITLIYHIGPCNASQPLKGVVQESVNSGPRIHGASIRDTKVRFHSNQYCNTLTIV